MDKKEFDSLNKDLKIDSETLLYGITPRLGSHLAERFKGFVVLETCSGAGFLTIELAKVAKKVITVDINAKSLGYAQHNTRALGVEKIVEFIQGDILNENTLKKIPKIDAAILDPVWNDQILSHMSPPATLLFETIKKRTQNIALILPPTTEKSSLDLFPHHELEMLYLDGELALLCLYFGKLARSQPSSFNAENRV